jgi:hypothetical protein
MSMLILAAGISPETMDICISNCVVNLSPDKNLVLNGVYTALVYGGKYVCCSSVNILSIKML